MKILIVNGSPAGEGSITLQTALYLEKLFPEHEYEHIDAAKKIILLDRDFGRAKDMLARAELIIFCYPVYTFLVPAQLHRFIELMKGCGLDFSEKYATQITTSKHFYDVTAHGFIRDNCLDMGLGFIRGLSADMEDLLSKKGRAEAEAFFRHLLFSVRGGICERGAAPKEAPATNEASVPESACVRTSGARAVIVTDLSGDDGRLAAMIGRFRAVCRMRTELVDLGEFRFAGGCLGCFNCASSGKCIYRDGFDVLLRDDIQTADATVYAFSIRDHSMGYRFKLYDDRQFCNGHRTVTMGKPVGYIVDGALSEESNLRMLIEARAEVGGNYLARVACSEGDTDREIDLLAAELEYAVENSYSTPANFYGVGGMKIFRDLIYTMQGLMREDHRFYREHGFYDFPQKRRGRIAGMYLVGSMMKNKKLAKKLGGNMTKGMLLPYRSVIEKAGKRK